MTKARTVGEPHSTPLAALGRRARTRRPRREVGRPKPSIAIGDDTFAWRPGECVLGLPGGGRRCAPVGGEP